MIRAVYTLHFSRRNIELLHVCFTLTIMKYSLLALVGYKKL